MNFNGLKQRIIEGLSGDTELYTEEARSRARELEHTTSLTPVEARVLAGDEHGLSDDAIDREIVYSGRSVHDIRKRLAEKRWAVEDELERKANTDDVLSEQYG